MANRIEELNALWKKAQTAKEVSNEREKETETGGGGNGGGVQPPQSPSHDREPERGEGEPGGGREEFNEVGKESSNAGIPDMVKKDKPVIKPTPPKEIRDPIDRSNFDKRWEEQKAKADAALQKAELQKALEKKKKYEARKDRTTDLGKGFNEPEP